MNIIKRTYNFQTSNVYLIRSMTPLIPTQMLNSTQSKLCLSVLLQKKYLYTCNNIGTKPTLDEFLQKLFEQDCIEKSTKYVWQLTGFISSKYFYLHCNLFCYLLTNLFIYSFTFCCVLMLLICCRKKKKSSSRLTHFANNVTFQWTSLFSRPGKIYSNLYQSTAQNLCTQIKGSLVKNTSEIVICYW